MKTFNQSTIHIEYPTTSKHILKGKSPFIRIYKDDHVYYGFYDKDIYLVELHRKPIQTKIILKNAILPNQQHNNNLNKGLNQIRGISYQLLYVSNNQYLCLGSIHNQIISFVIITIDLNTKGYYEIQDIQDIIENLNKKMIHK